MTRSDAKFLNRERPPAKIGGREARTEVIELVWEAESVSGRSLSGNPDHWLHFNGYPKLERATYSRLALAWCRSWLTLWPMKPSPQLLDDPIANAEHYANFGMRRLGHASPPGSSAWG